MKVKRLLRFYFCADELNSALDNIIMRRAVSSGLGARAEESMDGIIQIIAAKSELAELWNYLDKVFSTLGTEDVIRLHRYAVMRTGLRSLAEAEKRGIHSSLMKFSRRNVNLGSRFDGAIKVLGAYYCLMPPKQVENAQL